MKCEENLEKILTNVNSFINIKNDREKYATHQQEVQKQLFDKLNEDEVFASIFKGCEMSGSYGDNIKVSKPDEFDVVFHIALPDQKLIKVSRDASIPGNVYLNCSDLMHKIRKEQQHDSKRKVFNSWLDEQGYLLPAKLQSFLQGKFTRALASMKKELLVKGKRATLHYTVSGPAHTIHVKGNDNMEYSIDFVPGIRLNSCEDRQRVFATERGYWEAIPKPVRHVEAPRSFRASFYKEEQRLMQNKTNLKNTLRMMKKFRDSHQNMWKLKSYFIKTIFLLKAKKEGTQFWCRSSSTIVIEMFQELANSLENQFLPFLFDAKLNMYDQYDNKRTVLPEMLKCVQSARKTLEDASNNITESLRKNAYGIFLTRSEMKLVFEVTVDDVNNDMTNLTLQKHVTDDDLPGGPPSKEKSNCVLQ